jgi:hypothetical protein
MPQASSSHSAETERAELEIVLDALARTPRLANLLRYLGDKYFQGRTAEITEYNIATEVFGRSKSSFDGSTDSIARVEAHRLRKRLKEYYEKDGRDHAIVVSLPNRSYIPDFINRAAFAHAVTPSEPLVPTSVFEKQPLPPLPPSIAPAQTSHAVSKTPWARTALYAVAAIAVVLLVTFATARFSKRNTAAKSAGIASSVSPSLSKTPTPANAAHVPLRFLAGYEGSPKIDGAGEYWEPDRYYLGGTALQRPDATVIKTSDPMLFEHWRTNDFEYNIPLAPGPYELHLFFVASPQDDPKSSYFNVSANGQMLLGSFNIGSDALGANIADERVFKDIYPDKDGVLHLKFFQERSSPSLNALEILPGLPHRQLPVRLVMQRAALKDHNGDTWQPDNYFQNGTLSDPPRQVSGTPDSNLYAQERYGHFTYSIPVDTRGRYTLVLHFAELYWVPTPPDTPAIGKRIFRVYCNGSTLLDNFDIFKEAGSLHAITKTFNHLRPSPEGKLELTFEPIVNYATLSAIQVIDESE